MKYRFTAVLTLCAVSAFAQDPASVEEVTSLLKQHHFKVEPASLQQAVAEAMVRSADPHAQALSNADFEIFSKQRQGMFYDPGIQLSRKKNTVEISAVSPDSPAAKAGIEPGQELLAIDGVSVSNRRLPSVMNQLRGKGKMTLTLGGENEARDVDVMRELRPVPPIALQEELPGELVYLKLNGIFSGSTAPVSKVLRDWAKAGKFGLLLDLRDANGADVQAAADIAGLFSKENNTLFDIKDRAGKPLKSYQAKRGGPLGMPTMVLVNDGTRGASELLAVTLSRSVRGAMLIGEKTPGDLALRQFLPLQSGLQLYLATRTVSLADQQRFDGSKPIEPDILVADRNLPPAASSEPNRFGKQDDLSARELRERSKYDAILRRAIDVMQGLKALNIRTLGATPKNSR